MTKLIISVSLAGFTRAITLTDNQPRFNDFTPIEYNETPQSHSSAIVVITALSS